jgi:hypothetical protein
MQRKGKEIGQVGFEPTTCRIMRRAGAAGGDADTEGATGMTADASASPRTARLSRSVSRDLDRIADVLAECVALPTHGVAEAADLTVPRTMKLLMQLETAGKVSRVELSGVPMWTVARERAA